VPPLFSGRAARGLFVLALSLAAVRGTTAVNSEETRGLLDGRRFTPQQTQSLLVLLERADRRGLPVSALTNRVREGIARHAEPRAILGVVEDRLGQLEKADDVLRLCTRENVAVRDRERVLATLADAFAQGVTTEDAAELVAAAARVKGDVEAVARGAEILGQLQRKGFAARDARAVVAEAIAQGWSTERMEDIVGLFLEADALRLSPEDARQILVEGIRGKKERPILLEKLRRAALEERGRTGPGTRERESNRR